MSIITFWSPYKRSGSTSNMIAAAYMIGLTQRIRTLTMHMDLAGESCESGLPIRDPNTDFLMDHLSTTGWDAMYRLFSSGSLTKEKLRDCSVPLLRNQLDLLPGRYRHLFIGEDSISAHELTHILKISKEAYDLILLDAGSGQLPDPEIVKSSDVIIINLNQNMRELEHFFLDNKWKQDVMQHKVIISLGLYDDDSNCSPVNVKRRFGYRGPIISIPYSSSFRDAWNRREIGSYIHQTMDLDKKSGQIGDYAASIRELSKLILEYAGVRNRIKQLERGA